MCGCHNLNTNTLREISNLTDEILDGKTIGFDDRVWGESYVNPNALENQIAKFDSWNPKRYFEYGIFSENDISKIKNDKPIILSLGSGMCYVEHIIAKLGTPLENIYVTDTFVTKGMEDFPSKKILDMFQSEEEWCNILNHTKFDYILFFASLPMIKYGPKNLKDSCSGEEVEMYLIEILKKSLNILKPKGAIKIMQTELTDLYDKVEEVFSKIATVNIPKYNRYQQIEIIKE